MNFEDNVTYYSRKDYKAEVRLIAIEGNACSTDNIEFVELFKTQVWANYPIKPKYLYSVFDTTEVSKKIARGYIFYYCYGWGFVFRTGEAAGWSPFKKPEAPFLESWCKTPAEATAKVIRKSRTFWGKKDPQESTSNNYRSYQKPPQPKYHQSAGSDCQILGLTHPFDMSQLKKAYRILCLKHHPDYGGSADKFRQINEAYQRLKTKV
jgi:hypothetical protein